MRRFSVVFVRVMFAAAAISGAAESLYAQDRGAIAGVVRDSTGAAIPEAIVTIAAQGRETRTDSLGSFRFTRVSAGETIISIRRLGFLAMNVSVIVTGSGTDIVIVKLSQRALVLDEIAVSERDLRRRFWIDDFYRRRERGSGTYFTREDIALRRTSRLSDVLSNTPGIRKIRTSSGLGVRFVSAATLQRDCAPMIWLDGQRAPGMELDELQASDIEGVELYHGPSTTPLRFSQGHYTTCGTIVIWTRLPGT